MPSADRHKILVVDDEAAMREVLEIRLPPWGFEVATAADGAEARRLAESLDPELVISDVVLPDVSGLELLRWLKAGDEQRPVILMTAYGSVDAAVEAMKGGAEDFLTKPLDYSKLRTILTAVLESVALESVALGSAEESAEPGREPLGLGPLVGSSKPMRALYRLIELLAENEASAILTGESGTGKELVGRTIHDLSPRPGPFIALNAAAIPEGITESELFGHEKGAFTGATSRRAGCFELADGGTLFLDELAEMPMALQPKLLRVLEDGRVRRVGGSSEKGFDVRVLAATNREPERAVEEGRLREDLYYRLNVFTVEVPPLRQRTSDLPQLARHFLRQFNRKHRDRRHDARVKDITSEALELLGRYGWPGNVRELRNVMERAVILARRGKIAPRHLPAQVKKPGGGVASSIELPPRVSLAEAERILILETLERVGQNKAEAARRLGLDVKTIRNRLKAYAARA
ncbi:MAG: sigma-54-dependent Fis family transcriptional regulator [bacterium]|nr:sigma-54-dependent Fis family transcriptional regulator [bacterium]